MTLSTREFSLTRSEYFGILYREYLRQNRVAYLLFAVLILAGLFYGYWVFIAAGLFGAIILLIVRAFQIHRYTRDDQNRNLFLPRSVEVSDGTITVRAGGEAESTLPLSSIVRVVRSKEHYRLYYSRNQFLFLPHRAFAHPSDRDKLERALSSGRSRT
jgi:hypothetical protein